MVSRLTVTSKSVLDPRASFRIFGTDLKCSVIAAAAHRSPQSSGETDSIAMFKPRSPISTGASIISSRVPNISLA